MRAVPLVLALALAAAGCGSTAQVGGHARDGVVAFDESGNVERDELTLGDEDWRDLDLGQPVHAGQESVASPPSGAVSAGGATTDPTDMVSGPAEQGPSHAAPRTPLDGPLGPGVTAETIYIGVPYHPELGESAAALGAAGIDPGEERAYWAAIVDHLNAEGGIAGRNVEVVFFRDEGYSSQTQSDQAACSLWTEDKPVFAIIGRSSPAMRECAQNAGVLLLGLVFSSATTEVYEQYRNFVEVAIVRLDRAAQATVEGLHANGYFAGGAQIGIVTWDTPSYRTATERGLVRTLARHGLSATDIRYISIAESEQQIADSGSQVSNAVLRFRTQGIDHVIIQDGPAGALQGTGLTLLFLKSASGQAYYPKYGFNNANSPEGGIDAGLWTQDELDGSHLVTWDYHATNPDNDGFPNAAREFCEQLLTDNGIQPTNPNQWRLSLFACDSGLFLRAAVRAGGAVPTLEATLQGVARLDRTYNSPFNFANRFGPDRRDGAAAARRGVYDRGCHCYRYTTPPYQLP